VVFALPAGDAYNFVINVVSDLSVWFSKYIMLTLMMIDIISSCSHKRHHFVWTSISCLADILDVGIAIITFFGFNSLDIYTILDTFASRPICDIRSRKRLPIPCAVDQASSRCRAISAPSILDTCCWGLVCVRCGCCMVVCRWENTGTDFEDLIKAEKSILYPVLN